MPRRRVGWIDWAKSDAKKVILQDLEDKVLPLEEHLVSAETAWNLHYVHMPEFLSVEFSQFKDRLADHREQISRKKNHQNAQLVALQKMKAQTPPKTHNKRGVKNFYLTEAATKLKEDVESGIHLQLAIEAFYMSRPEYHQDEWDINFFKIRVRQAVALQKFRNWMKHKKEERAKKEAKKKKKQEEENQADWDCFNDYYG